MTEEVTIDMAAAREAAEGMARAGDELLAAMDPESAFHALLCAAIIFGSPYFGRQGVAGWLRTVADEIDRPETAH